MLDDIPYEDAEDYLVDKYGNHTVGKYFRIKSPVISDDKIMKEMSEEIVTQAVSPYLLARGITPEIQRLHGVGYSEDVPGYTAIPWRTPDGKLATVMYRSTRDKAFFYRKGGIPRGRLVYGIDVVNKQSCRKAVICEAAIDALSWWTAGVPAIAIGGAKITNEQADIIRRSSLESVILGGDSDETGAVFNVNVRSKLASDLQMSEVNYGQEKDANAVLQAKGVDGLRSLTIAAIAQIRLNLLG